MNVKHLDERLRRLEQTTPDTEPSLRHMSDEELEKRAGEILAKHPPERDHELSDRPPGPGVLVGHMSDRAVVQRARQIYESRHGRRRDTEPTPLRQGK